MEFQPIATAPRDGTKVLIKTIMEYAFPAYYAPDSSMDEDMKPCGQWVAAIEGFHPPCWSDGACWTSNSDEVHSDPPVAWKDWIEEV